MKGVAELQREFMEDTGILLDRGILRKYVNIGLVKLSDDLSEAKRMLAVIQIGFKPSEIQKGLVDSKRIKATAIGMRKVISLLVV